MVMYLFLGRLIVSFASIISFAASALFASRVHDIQGMALGRFRACLELRQGMVGENPPSVLGHLEDSVGVIANLHLSRAHCSRARRTMVRNEGGRAPGTLCQAGAALLGRSGLGARVKHRLIEALRMGDVRRLGSLRRKRHEA